jgi:hypothetical protein
MSLAVALAPLFGILIREAMVSIGGPYPATELPLKLSAKPIELLLSGNGLWAACAIR